MADIPSIARQARSAARMLAASEGTARAKALALMADKLAECKDELLEANRQDLEFAIQNGTPVAFQKRLEITEKVFAYMLRRLNEASALPDPVGQVLEGRRMPNGLKVSRVSVPLGVVAIIYEARPNVTTDAAAVALKSANAVILKGGSESIRSNRVLVKAMRSAIADAGLPVDAVQFVDSTDRQDVATLLQQSEFVDVIIPRGGKSLIKAVSENTKIPVIKHYDGICHHYVAEDADIEMAVKVVLNSKTERVEVCNALETLLVDAKIAGDFLPMMAAAFREKGVEIRGCERTCVILPGIKAACAEDWDAEYLAPIIAVRVVDGIQEAIDHIALHGSGHTDGILTSSLRLSREFVAKVDSASVLVNASTRLSGGGDYGMGAVVGISTDKLHARGPVGPAELCSYKWIAEGDGHLR
ncbi:MAG: glutamate-5-semialdehyde dehydrogenase [Lentisphaerae bacterium]|jgi:glutamate-5-semialdehyde dehydrogenase|nr:glutamate-5-semialdehyde dehydrogenase [Lentisphaerota bacterium]